MKLKIIIIIFFAFLSQTVWSQLDSITIVKQQIAENIVGRYIYELGTPRKIKKIDDYTVFMSSNLNGTKLKITKYYKAPNLFLKVMFADTVMIEKQIYDGKKGQKITLNNETHEIIGGELQSLKYEATIFLETQYEDLGFSLLYDTTETVNGQPTHRIIATDPFNKKLIQYYDTTTNMKIQEQEEIVTGRTSFTATRHYSDYREIEGVLFPHLIVHSFKGNLYIFNVDTTMINTKISKKYFKLK